MYIKSDAQHELVPRGVLFLSMWLAMVMQKSLLQFYETRGRRCHHNLFSR